MMRSLTWKKIGVIIICVISFCGKSYAQYTDNTPCENLVDNALCGKHLLFVEEGLVNYFNNGSTLELEIKLDVYNGSSISSSMQYTTVLSDPSAFVYVSDFVDIDEYGSTTKWLVYDIKVPNVLLNGRYYTLVATPVLAELYSPHLYCLSGKTKICGTCPESPTIFQLDELYNKLYTEFYGIHITNQIPPGLVRFRYLSLLQIQSVTKLIVNNILGLSDTTGFYEYYNSLIVSPSTFTISSFGQSQNYQENSCPCNYNVLALLKSVVKILKNDWNGRNLIQSYLDVYRYSNCNCASEYCFYVDVSAEEVSIHGIPFTNNLNPLISCLIHKSGSSPVIYGISSSYSFNGTDLQKLWTYDFIPTDAISFDGTNFTKRNDYNWFDESTLSSICDFPCTDCISSFSPSPDSEYIFNAWVSVDNYRFLSTLVTPNVYFDFNTPGGVINMGPYTASGNIIDGWQRIEQKFTVPSGATTFRLRLESTDMSSYFDDIRILPVNSSMKSFVYDPVTLRLSAVLDEQHYATFYEYDEDGKLVRVKKETERGIMTINENKSSIVKRDH